MKKVVKFGGSSLASAEQFKKVGAIIKSDESRVYVVPSAPGKRFSDDTKVTDMLLHVYETAKAGNDFTEEVKAIKARYDEIITGLEIKDFSLDKDFEEITKQLEDLTNPDPMCTLDYVASRGEFLNGKIMAAYLGFEFIDAAEVIFFNAEGNLNSYKTEKVLGERLSKAQHAVVPGFYGLGKDGKVKTFSRGGSDISGALAAAAIDADMYENWTDVSGILMADPRIVKDPQPIEKITYAELRELAFMGASVLHEESVLPVKEKGIALNIRNTNCPEHPGTVIVDKIEDEESHERFLTGIAGRKNFTIITVNKRNMNTSQTLRQALEILDRYHANVEHITLGLDSFALVTATAPLGDGLYSLMGDLEKSCHPDNIQVNDGIALVAAVGRKMTYRPGISGKIFRALGEEKINIRTIAQGADELSIIVGVENKNFEAAVRVLYESFAG